MNDLDSARNGFIIGQNGKISLLFFQYIDTCYMIWYIFLDAKLWIPGGGMSISTAVIH